MSLVCGKIQPNKTQQPSTKAGPHYIVWIHTAQYQTRIIAELRVRLSVKPSIKEASQLNQVACSTLGSRPHTSSLKALFYQLKHSLLFSTFCKK